MHWNDDGINGFLAKNQRSNAVVISPYNPGDEEDEAKRACTAGNFLEASLFLFGRMHFSDFVVTRARPIAVITGDNGGGGVFGGRRDVLCGGGHGCRGNKSIFEQKVRFEV